MSEEQLEKLKNFLHKMIKEKQEALRGEKDLNIRDFIQGKYEAYDNTLTVLELILSDGI